jgi:glycosyltransferase involved in cell wall biosynthesis
MGQADAKGFTLLERGEWKPIVSAIVSAYFCADFLLPRLRNLLEQACAAEVVAMCQAGSDEESIARDALEHRRGVIVTTPDIPTVYAAWNLGIAASHGEYLTNANSDDWLAPDGLGTLAAALDARPDVAVAYGDQDVVESLVGGFFDAQRIGGFRWMEGGFPELLKMCFLGPMPMWRRELHAKYGMFDEHMVSAGDYEFWLRLAAKGEAFFHVRKVIGLYMQRADSVEHRNADLAARETRIARMRYGGKDAVRARGEPGHWAGKRH